MAERRNIDEIDINDYLEVVWKRKFIILVFILIGSLIIGLPSLSQKKVYKATATILLKGGSGIAGENKSIAGLVGGGGLSQSSAFPSVIKSESVAEIVLDRENLRERVDGWDDPAIPKQSLISSVQSMPDINPFDMFKISVTTEDPQLSADIANAFAYAGKEFWGKINYTESKKKREYIEQQLPRLGKELKMAETKLKDFSLLAPIPFSLQGVELDRLRREYTILNETYTMLRRELESVKLDESKELDPFVMIDRAKPPLGPVQHNKKIKFVLGAILGLFFGMAASFVLEFWENLKKKS